ncbi:hypothetical protein L1887_08469 [Cichorium endivia]|nr:hypothetical protein L1887_08469 [Cichorium endivia]
MVYQVKTLWCVKRHTAFKLDSSHFDPTLHCAVVVNPSIEVVELGENDGDFLLLTQRLGEKIEDGKMIYALMAQNEELERKVEVLEKME